MVLSWGIVNFLKVVSSFHVSCRQYCVHVCVHVCVCVCVCLYVEMFRIRVRSLTKEIQQLPEISSTNTGGYILFPVCYEWSISTLFCKVLFFVQLKISFSSILSCNLFKTIIFVLKNPKFLISLTVICFQCNMKIPLKTNPSQRGKKIGIF